MLAGNRLKTCFGASFAISSTLVCAVQTGKKISLQCTLHTLLGPGPKILLRESGVTLAGPGQPLSGLGLAAALKSDECISERR